MEGSILGLAGDGVEAADGIAVELVDMRRVLCIEGAELDTELAVEILGVDGGGEGGEHLVDADGLACDVGAEIARTQCLDVYSGLHIAVLATEVGAGEDLGHYGVVGEVGAVGGTTQHVVLRTIVHEL